MTMVIKHFELMIPVCIVFVATQTDAVKIQ